MALLRTIKAAPKVESISYLHRGEDVVNPAYCNIEDTPAWGIGKNEKRIWVLRTDTLDSKDESSDLRLVTGVKNEYHEEGDSPLAKALDTRINYKECLSPTSRYGHPTLAIPEEKSGYTGSVYLAGWLAQRCDDNGKRYIEVFMQSGRYQNHALTDFELDCLEIYIARRFMHAYGSQDVIFIDYSSLENFYDYLGDRPLTHMSPDIIRTYTPALIQRITAMEEQSVEITVDMLQNAINESEKIDVKADEKAEIDSDMSTEMKTDESKKKQDMFGGIKVSEKSLFKVPSPKLLSANKTEFVQERPLSVV